MHCTGCEARIVRVLQRLPGVRQATASHESQRVSVTIDPTRVTLGDVQTAIKQAGFDAAPASGKADPTGGGSTR